VDALAAANALEQLVERLARLDESVDEEARGVHAALALLEHALEVRGCVCVCVLVSPATSTTCSCSAPPLPYAAIMKQAVSKQ
jgi:hypothetical protein